MLQFDQCRSSPHHDSPLVASVGNADPHPSLFTPVASVGNADVHPTVGNADVHPTVGNADVHTTVGNADVHTTVGNADVHPIISVETAPPLDYFRVEHLRSGLQGERGRQG